MPLRPFLSYVPLLVSKNSSTQDASTQREEEDVPSSRRKATQMYISCLTQHNGLPLGPPGQDWWLGQGRRQAAAWSVIVKDFGPIDSSLLSSTIWQWTAPLKWRKTELKEAEKNLRNSISHSKKNVKRSEPTKCFDFWSQCTLKYFWWELKQQRLIVPLSP